MSGEQFRSIPYTQQRRDFENFLPRGLSEEITEPIEVIDGVRAIPPKFDYGKGPYTCVQLVSDLSGEKWEDERGSLFDPIAFLRKHDYQPISDDPKEGDIVVYGYFAENPAQRQEQLRRIRREPTLVLNPVDDYFLGLHYGIFQRRLDDSTLIITHKVAYGATYESNTIQAIPYHVGDVAVVFRKVPNTSSRVKC